VKVLLLGSGAREHALAWKLVQSKALSRLFVLSGNPGIARIATCLPGDPADVATVLTAARAQAIDLVVVGPEAPLVAGVADALRAAGIAVFGPSQSAARLEGSKAFAKEVMAEAGVPTARAEVFVDLEAAAKRARAWGRVVVKADGLAQGKGVEVCDDGAQAELAVRRLGATTAGVRLVLEERLTGPELSLIALCDGKNYSVLPGAHDAKQLFDGDRGPNTGGMGAFAPSPLSADEAIDELAQACIAPMLEAMSKRGTPFVGALFAGLMMTPEGPQVLEYNCRSGDPETQALMALVDDDVLGVFAACARGALGPGVRLRYSGAAVGVVLAASGYPQAPRSGDVITGIAQAEAAGAFVFHAGTTERGGQLVTSGGRVLTVVARGATMPEARAKAYAATEHIAFAGRQLRTDIGIERWR
jgi:phosphoribosylamine---glycine ligase